MMEKRMRNSVMAAACVCACLLSGCVSRVGDFTVLSTKNMDFNNREGFETRVGQRTVGQDKQHFVLIFPVSGSASVKEAADAAMHRVPGAVGLSNVVLYKTGYWLLLYGNSGFRVEGDPVFPKNAKPANPR